jgi:hypothetical protein
VIAFTACAPGPYSRCSRGFRSRRLAGFVRDSWRDKGASLPALPAYDGLPRSVRVSAAAVLKAPDDGLDAERASSHGCDGRLTCACMAGGEGRLCPLTLAATSSACGMASSR